MNIEHFKRVLNHIKSHPETWDQRVWHRETKHDFISWCQIFAGKPKKVLTALYDACEWLDIDLYDGKWLLDPRRTISDFERFLKTKRANRGIPLVRRLVSEWFTDSENPK